MKSTDEVNEFKKLAMQLEKMLAEFGELSKKKPDSAVNKFKLKLVNTLLSTANGIIDADCRPFSEFETFEEDSVPTNSDVLMILSQYRACLVKFFQGNIRGDSLGGRYWIIKGKVSSVEAPSSYSLLS